MSLTRSATHFLKPTTGVGSGACVLSERGQQLSPRFPVTCNDNDNTSPLCYTTTSLFQPQVLFQFSVTPRASDLTFSPLPRAIVHPLLAFPGPCGRQWHNNNHPPHPRNHSQFPTNNTAPPTSPPASQAPPSPPPLSHPPRRPAKILRLPPPPPSPTAPASPRTSAITLLRRGHSGITLSQGKHSQNYS